MTDPTNSMPQDTPAKAQGLVESQIVGQRRLQNVNPADSEPQNVPATGSAPSAAQAASPAAQVNLPASPPAPAATTPDSGSQPGPIAHIAAAIDPASQAPSTPIIPTTPSPPPPVLGPAGQVPSTPGPPVPAAPNPTITGSGPANNKKPPKGSYPIALILTGSIIPVTIAAAILTSVLYFSPIPLQLYNLIPWVPPSWIVILAGLAITLLLWLLSSIPFRRFTTFDNANALSSNHIKSHLRTLQASYTALQHEASSTQSNRDPASPQNSGSSQRESSFEKVGACLNAISEELEHEDLRWAAGTGYLNIWNFINRAEEAMIDIAPRVEVIREAFYDELSLEGSSIDSRNAALAKLRTAVMNLSPSAAQYMDTPPPPASNSSATGKNNGTKNGGTVNVRTEQEARDAIHIIKQTINEFRDGLWEGLVRMRNQLTGITLYTGLLTYVLLCTAIIAGASSSSIKAATIFYMVGAMVGLFGRLYTESQADQAINDYGLTLARIVVTPILAGLASVAGILVVAMFSYNLLKAPAAITTGPFILNDIYSLDRNLQGIIVAAVFGLTPNLLISVLQQKAGDFQAQLKNSSAPNQGKN
jgi:hypothetical protein